MIFESGNLIYDFGENISNIVWSADGKVLSVVKTNNDRLDFLYDSKGERVRKLSYNAVTVTNKNTYYLREANGQVLAVYEANNTPAEPRIALPDLDEWYIYGSESHGRFARWLSEPCLGQATTKYSVNNPYNFALHSRYLKYKEYESKDHLGDVRLVFSDLKLRTQPPPTIPKFALDVRSVNNYYPFGMMMPFYCYQTTSFPKYRYGYNGMERDDEVKTSPAPGAKDGTGNSYDYGARFYDPRVGRFLSIDPLSFKYPDLSDYVGLANNPIIIIDLDGKEIRITGSDAFKQAAFTALQKLTNNKLEIDNKTGTIKINEINTVNLDKELIKGNTLLNELTKIGPDEPVFYIQNSTLDDDDKNGKADNGFDPYTNVISFNPTEDKGGIDIKGKTKRPIEIGLGHELIHASHLKFGTLFLDMKTFNIYLYNPDTKLTGWTNDEEVKTIKEENQLRKEQKVTPRKEPSNERKVKPIEKNTKNNSEKLKEKENNNE